MDTTDFETKSKLESLYTLVICLSLLESVFLRTAHYFALSSCGFTGILTCHIFVYIYIYIYIYISTVGVLVQARSPFFLFSFVRSCVSARASGLVGMWESNAKSGYTLCLFALFLDHPPFFQQFLLCVSARRFRLYLVQSRRHRSDIELKLKWSQSEIEVNSKWSRKEFYVNSDWNRSWIQRTPGDQLTKTTHSYMSFVFSERNLDQGRGISSDGRISCLVLFCFLHKKRCL